MSEVNRQYIGARYVPKFFENPNTGDSTWLEGVGYEPLTIVSYAGNSYTSKKPVPAGIGSPNLNGAYWVNTGNFNAQVESLRTDINALDDRLDHEVETLGDRIAEEVNSLSSYTNEQLARKVTVPDYGKFIIIGDSYVGMGLGAEIKTILSLDAVVFPAGGGCFAGTGGEYTFLTALQAVAEQMTEEEKKAVTDIMVLGGYNDFTFTAEAIGTAIDAFNLYARANFPKARITLGMVAYSTRENDLGLIEEVVVPTYARKAMLHQWRYIPYANSGIHFTSAMSSDGVHPIAGGITAIANYIAQFIHSGLGYYSARLTSSLVPSISPSSGALSMDSDLNNGICTLKIGGTGFVFNSAYSFANGLDFSQATLIGSFDGFVRGYTYQTKPNIAIPVPILSVYINDQTFEDCDGVVYIVNGNLYLAIRRKYPNHTGAFTSSSFGIPPVTISLPSEQC